MQQLLINLWVRDIWSYGLNHYNTHAPNFGLNEILLCLQKVQSQATHSKHGQNQLPLFVHHLFNVATYLV